MTKVFTEEFMNKKSQQQAFPLDTRQKLIPHDVQKTSTMPRVSFKRLICAQYKFRVNWAIRAFTKRYFRTDFNLKKLFWQLPYHRKTKMICLSTLKITFLSENYWLSY